MRAFNTNYGDITRETPFQVQSELLFMYRAMGILSGIATDLDPDFDLWSAAEPLARQMIQDELRKNWREWLAEIVAFTQQVVGLSGRIDHLVGHMQRGDLTVQMALAPDTRRAATRLDGAIRRLTWAVVGSGMLIAGAAWHIGDTIVAALSPQAAPRPDVGLWLAGLALVTLVVGLLRGGR
jgi:predicted unusual protein kinase regulating ubiquinone biosynthesis (AarF/ABC1/UbiB family)